MQPTRNRQLPALQPMSEADRLEYLYNDYLNQGHLVLAVTLTPIVYNDQFAASPSMRSFFEKHFLGKIDRYLPGPLKGKYGYDFVIEQSPAGLWHFHGLLAFRAEAGSRIWKEGGLNHHLRRDLNSMRSQGELRPCRLIDYQIGPVSIVEGGIKAWTGYFTKTSTYISSSNDAWHNSRIALGTSGSSPGLTQSLKHSAERLRKLRQRSSVC